MNDPQLKVELQERLSSLERALLDHKRLETVLSRSAGQKEAILDALKEPIAYHDRTFRVLWVNLAAADLLGKRRDRLIGMHCYEAWENRTTPCEQCPLVHDAKMPWVDEGTSRGKKTWRRRVFAIRNQTGETIGGIEVATDVTELEATRMALERERAFNRTLTQSTPAYILELDAEGRVRMMNRAMLDTLGITREEAEGRDFLSAFVPESDREAVAAMLEDIETRKRPTLSESRIAASDGKEALVQWQGLPVIHGKGAFDGYLAMGTDVTQTRRLETQLMRAQKLEALGTLAGGIAHDFNNLLQAIRGYTDLLLLREQKEGGEQRELREIQRAAGSASELTEQLLSFSRKAKRDLGPVDINQQVLGIHKILKRTIPKMIAVDLDLEDGLWSVRADNVQVEQLLMNLSLNARDAMPGGGTLEVETRNVRLDRAFCDGHAGANPGPHVLIRVSDTGGGIDPDVRNRMFEPFFTTKEPGKGSGMGLAMVYGIVKNLKGFIACSSEPGKGTVFEVFLPASRDSVAPEAAGPVEKLPGGKERILLVDDDRNIRDLGEEILKKFGYEVRTAEDGESALDLYEKQPNAIDLVILDLIMPGMGGIKCLKNIVEIDRQARVLIASGTCPSREDASLTGLSCGFIRKPYDIGSMLCTIREVLDQGAEGSEEM